MPAATTKAELLAVTERDWAKLAALMASVPDRRALCPVDGETSIRDVVAHRAHWIDLFFQWLDEGRAGGPVAMPDHGVKWSELKAYNAALRARHAGLGKPFWRTGTRGCWAGCARRQRRSFTAGRCPAAPAGRPAAMPRPPGRATIAARRNSCARRCAAPEVAPGAPARLRRLPAPHPVGPGRAGGAATGPRRAAGRQARLRGTARTRRNPSGRTGRSPASMCWPRAAIPVPACTISPGRAFPG